MANLTTEEWVKHVFPDDINLHTALDCGNKPYVVQTLKDFILGGYNALFPAKKLLAQLKEDPYTLEERLDRLAYVEYLLKKFDGEDAANLDNILESMSKQ